MNAKTTVMLGLRIVVLTFLLFVCYSIASVTVGLTDSTQTAESMGVMVALLVVCALETIVLSYTIIRSRWTGWRLVVTIFFVFYGVKTFLSQIETVVFLDYLVDIVPAEMIPKLFMQGAIIAALFSPLAVLIHGRMKGAKGMIKGDWWKAGLAVALLFSVLMSAQLLVAGEIMPDRIRMAHFVELLSSGFLFGWIVVWLLNRHHGSLCELFQWSEGERGR